MTYRIRIFTVILLIASLTALVGCAGTENREAAVQTAPVPPPPGTNAGAALNTSQETKKQSEDLPDRVFAPLDDAVNVINRDINRDLDKEFPENRNSPPPGQEN